MFIRYGLNGGVETYNNDINDNDEESVGPYISMFVNVNDGEWGPIICYHNSVSDAV